MSSDKYNHSEVETRIYSYWEKNNLFKPALLSLDLAGAGCQLITEN